MVTFKSFIGPAIEPLGAIWLLTLMSAFWLVWRRQWKSAFWLGPPLVLLYVVGSTSLPERLVASAERPFSPPAPLSANPNPWAGADAVVVLGGGYYQSDRDPFGFNLSLAGGRLLAGVELARVLKPKALILGGSVPHRSRPEPILSTLIQHWVQSWGVANGGVITNLGVCPDTHAEAVSLRNLRERSDWKKIVLVTSALHMPRSIAVFKQQGVDVVPFACDFQAWGTSRFSGYSPFPRQERFTMLSAYLHELIGNLVYTWRGWI